MVSAKAVCTQVLRKITPKGAERKLILSLAKRMRRRVSKAASHFKLKAKVRIDGSVAKDTWLSGEADVDIFIQVPTKLSQEKFQTACLEVAKRALEGYRWIERFAEHPYLETWVDGTRVDIVPCYAVKRGEWLRATDRTPFHTKYVKKHLTEHLKGEVRLLKKFMKGVGVYGAEIKIGGFSGYLCELLILYYKSFLNVLAAAMKWGRPQIIDLENYYRNRLDEVKKLFEASLIIIDPIDKGRNVAAAVAENRLYEFIAASKAFLEKPSLHFFYPVETKPILADALIEKLKMRGTDLVFIKFGEVKAVPDILWGQLYRSLRALANLLKQNEFNIIRATTWSDETANNTLIFELESRTLPPIKKHVGPPIDSKEAKAFLAKHVGAPHTFSGPWIENGRWMVEIKRKYTDAIELLKDKLRDNGVNVGVTKLLSEEIKKSHKVLANEGILDFYASNIGFAKFLTEFLIGRPHWLEQPS